LFGLPWTWIILERFGLTWIFLAWVALTWITFIGISLTWIALTWIAPDLDCPGREFLGQDCPDRFAGRYPSLCPFI